MIGLDLGADDYITKPFAMMEFISRVKAVLRRTAPKPENSEIFCAGEIILNTDRHTVSAGGNDVALTLKEFELLKTLMENKGFVMTRDKLLNTVWGYDFDGETRTVDVHIRSLRIKLGDPSGVIETVRGVGYRIG